MGFSTFKQVDVFTTKRFAGNPVAVIMDASELTTEQMQTIANWTNLSETTFVVPVQNAEADYRVRIFTPGSELPFAGHPTIGTAYALLEAGLITPKDGAIIQECEAGLINLSVTTSDTGSYFISFALPQPVITPLTSEQVDRLDAILGSGIDRTLTPAIVDVGPRWLVAQMHNADTVLNTTPDFAKLAIHDVEMGITGITAFGAWTEGSYKKIETRSFAPSCGVNEDPVCGSGNGSVAAFLRHHQATLPSSNQVLASQGQKLKRNGQLILTITAGKILVGGNAVTCVDGKINY